MLRGICQHVIDAFGATKVAIAHRTGVCPVGDASVIIVVSSAHRRAAIDGMAYAIDQLKARGVEPLSCSVSGGKCQWSCKFTLRERFPPQAAAPIWKKEFYEDGSVWKENAEDRERRRREQEQR